MPTQAEKDEELLALAEKAQNDSVNSGVNAVDSGVNVLPTNATATVGEPSAPVSLAHATPAPTIPDPSLAVAVPADRQVTDPVENKDQSATTATPVPTSPPGPPTEAGSMQALNQAQKSAYSEADSQKVVGNAKADQLSADAKSQQIETDEARNAEKELADKQKAIDSGRAKAQSLIDSATDKLDKYKFHHFFEDMSDGERIRTKFAVALGAFAAAGQYSNNPHNQVLDQVNKIIDQQSRSDEQEVRKQYDIAKLRQEGAQQFEANMASDLALIKIKQGHAQHAAASELKSQLMENGVPLAKAESDATYKKFISAGDENKSKGYAALMKIHGDLALARFKASQNQPADPRALADVAEFAKTHDQAETYRYAAGKGIKDTNKSVQPIIDNNNSTDSKKTAADEKEAARTITLGGETLVAPSPRMAENVEKRAENYADALESLKGLKEKLHRDPVTGRYPSGDEYDRAVLAVAATTTANPSDATTSHEAGTLKNWKIVSEDAIDRTYSHIKERQEKFLSAYRKKGSVKATTGTGQAKGAVTSHPVGTVVTSGGKMYRVINDNGDIEPVQ